ncbi:uncharacterized protein [Argopecten irradians]|uniref:uncharacterized protein isoform X2 n=1 Tax=Argopecten irradians TaxID=31199 RepID=UPI0037106270
MAVYRVLLLFMLFCTTSCQDSATYLRKGDQMKLLLPKPPNTEKYVIALNTRTIFQFFDGEIDGGNTTEDDVNVRLTSEHAELEIDSTNVTHAGYYYTKIISGDIVLGGTLIVVTDTPTVPTITSFNTSPLVDETVILECASSVSRSNPDNHGLSMTYNWKLNGSFVTDTRFTVKDTSLVISSVRPEDRYSRFTCQTREETRGYSGPPSEDSDEFIITPLYGPQFVDIEGADGRSPLIIGDVFGPVICKTDCNPACMMEWRREGVLLRRTPTSDNTLVLRDSQLPRKRKETYTCTARVPTNAGFTTSAMEKNVTIEIHFPARITRLRYQNETEELNPVVTNDVIRLPEADSLVLNVDADSNPNPNVTLIRHNHVITWTDVAGVTEGYELVLDNLKCDDTGTYDVRASNDITRNTSERQLELQVTCAPRRRDSSNSTICLTGKRDQIIPLDVIVIVNPSPTVHWSDGVMDTSIVQNNSYTYNLQGSVLITSAEGYMYRQVNISNGVGELLTIIFKIRAEAPDNIQFKLPFLILAGLVGILTLTIIVLTLVIRRQHTDKEKKRDGNPISARNHRLQNIASPEDENDHVYASADEIGRENVSNTASNHGTQTESIKRQHYSYAYFRDQRQTTLNKRASENVTSDDQEYIEMYRPAVRGKKTNKTDWTYQDLYQTTDPEHLYGF